MEMKNDDDFFFLCIRHCQGPQSWKQRHVVWRREGPTSRQNPMGPALLHLCETRHGLWDAARGFRAAHPKLPALHGLVSRMRYASCISFVSSGSCPHSIRDFLCEAGAGALYFFTRASSAGTRSLDLLLQTRWQVLEPHFRSQEQALCW